jgi:regulator of replication initiation timing
MYARKRTVTPRKKILGTRTRRYGQREESDDGYDTSSDDENHDRKFQSPPNEPQFIFEHVNIQDNNRFSQDIPKPQFKVPQIAQFTFNVNSIRQPQPVLSVNPPTFFETFNTQTQIPLFTNVPQAQGSSEHISSPQPTFEQPNVLDRTNHIPSPLPSEHVQSPAQNRQIFAEPQNNVPDQQSSFNILDQYFTSSNNKLLLSKDATVQELMDAYNELLANIFDVRQPQPYQQSVQENNMRNLEAQKLREELKSKNELLEAQIAILEEKNQELELTCGHMHSHQRFRATDSDLRQYRYEYTTAKRIMSLQKDPTESELNAAYRSALRRVHPDTNPSMTKKDALDKTKELTACRDLIRSVITNGLKKHTKMQIDPTYYAFKKTVASLKSECDNFTKSASALRGDIAEIKNEIRKVAV